MECLIYLFSLKLSSPNKVFLLRGKNELSDKNVATLKSECSAKYGSEYGNQVFSMFLETFAKLPAAVIVDENVLCVNSGIPKSNNIYKLYSSKKEIPNAHQDPTVYEASSAHTLSSTHTQETIALLIHQFRFLSDYNPTPQSGQSRPQECVLQEDVLPGSWWPRYV